MKRTHRYLSLIVMIAAVAVLPVPVSATADPLIITATTTLTANHIGNIIIATDGVTLDCAGFVVIGSGGPAAGSGIELQGRTGVTVKNCIVTNFNAGFRLTSFAAEPTSSANSANTVLVVQTAATGSPYAASPDSVS